MKEVYMIKLHPRSGYEFTEEDNSKLMDMWDESIHESYESVMKWGESCLNLIEEAEYFTVEKEYHRGVNNG